MEEEGIVWSGILDEPMHCSQNVLFCRLAHGVLLVVGQDDHVFAPVSKLLGEIRRHVAYIIDTTSQLATLTKIVDTDEQGLASASALGVLERVVLRCAASEVLRRAWGNLH